jgi:hypothetical protein
VPPGNERTGRWFGHDLSTVYCKLVQYTVLEKCLLRAATCKKRIYYYYYLKYLRYTVGGQTWPTLIYYLWKWSMCTVPEVCALVGRLDLHKFITLGLGVRLSTWDNQSERQTWSTLVYFPRGGGCLPEVCWVGQTWPALVYFSGKGGCLLRFVIEARSDLHRLSILQGGGGCLPEMSWVKGRPDLQVCIFQGGGECLPDVRCAWQTWPRFIFPREGEDVCIPEVCYGGQPWPTFLFPGRVRMSTWGALWRAGLTLTLSSLAKMWVGTESCFNIQLLHYLVLKTC